ncbi:hypothetical protein HMPREF9056_02272 [Actinomyces sp. oral taxon 170 str. F0386]|nr:hypothetical protein HMPREF9056_02272 [Actinomyces sp. oral taxon 170 str. F0386]
MPSVWLKSRCRSRRGTPGLCRRTRISPRTAVGTVEEMKADVGYRRWPS